MLNNYYISTYALLHKVSQYLFEHNQCPLSVLCFMMVSDLTPGKGGEILLSRSHPNRTVIHACI